MEVSQPIARLENVFATEGMPHITFVQPPNFNNIYLDFRHDSKPVILEGPSGTGKTCIVLKILERVNKRNDYIYFSARKPSHIISIIQLTNEPDNKKYIIDDFHRLPTPVQRKLADIAKISADGEDLDKYPKLVFVGINQVGETLLNLSPDIAKRCGIHKIKSGSLDNILELIRKGEKELNIKISNPNSIFKESKGDYWLAQTLCKVCCLQNGILEYQYERQTIKVNVKDIRTTIIENLSAGYNHIVKEFCKGKRFRSTNDSYFTLLEAVSKSDEMPADLEELANTTNDTIKIAINGVKSHRLKVHIEGKPVLNKNFFYDEATKSFNIEDPAMYYFIKYLDWKKLKKDCGFKKAPKSYKVDIAISFAGENRVLAEFIFSKLRELDIQVFYDKIFEDEYLGSSWSEHFKNYFTEDSRLVVCLLDKHHKEKIWPTFERECFMERVKDNSVIPVFIDETVFVGIPKDVVSIKFKCELTAPDWKERASKEIVDRIVARLDSI